MQLAPAIEAMTTLNSTAARIMVEEEAHSATDITGFGLAVHLLEVARASGVSLEVSFDSVPFFPNAKDLSRQSVKTGNTLANEQAAIGQISFGPAIERADQLLFFDPQTSGGLAIFAEAKRAALLLRRLQDEGVPAFQIGEAGEGPPFLSVI